MTVEREIGVEVKRKRVGGTVVVREREREGGREGGVREEHGQGDQLSGR